MGINIVDFLGITFDEKIISNLISGLINESKNFRCKFLKSILEIDNPEKYVTTSEIQIPISKDNPSIVIISEATDKVILSFLETSLKATEGHNQRMVYSKEACYKHFLGDKQRKKKLEVKYIYLNLIQDDEEKSSDYISKTYEDLIDKVWVEIEDDFLNKIYKDFCNEILNFYREMRIENKDKILPFINQDSLEKQSIRCREVMLSIKFPRELQVNFFGSSIGRDKLALVNKIYKEEWRGIEARWEKEEYIFGEDTYDIHTELNFDIENREVVLNIHYEPNPYVTRTLMNKWASKDRCDAFNRARTKFINAFYKKLEKEEDLEIRKRDGINTFAYGIIKLDENLTVDEFKKLLLRKYEFISKAIDEILLEM